MVQNKSSKPNNYQLDYNNNQELEFFVSLLLNNTDEFFVYIDLNFKVVFFNKQFYEEYYKFFKVKIKKGESIVNYAQPERRSTVTKIYEEVFAGKQMQSEISLPDPDGNMAFLELKYKPAKTFENKTVGAFVSIKNITEIKLNTLKLEENEKKYRALVENGGDAVAILAADGKPTYVSPSVKTVLGYNEKEALALNLFEVLHPEDVIGVQKALEVALAKPGVPVAGYTSRLKHKDGTWHWYESTITNLLHDPIINGIVDNFRDVTHRKLLEEKQSLLAAVVNSTDDAIYTTDLNGIITSWNKGAEKLFGFNAHVALHKNINIIYNNASNTDFELWKNQLLKGLPLENQKVERKRKNGQLVIVSETVSPIVNSSGYIIGASSICRDITQKIKAENKLIESERRLSFAQKIAQIGNWDLNLQTGFTFWSEEVYHIFQLKPYSFKPNEHSILNFIHADEKFVYTKHISQVKQRLFTLDIENKITTANNTIKYVHQKGTIEYDDNGKPLWLRATIQDVTSKKLATQELLFYKNLIENSTDGIGMINLLDQSIFLNNAFKEFLGYSEQEMLQMGGPFTTYNNQKQAKEVEEILLAGKHWNGDIVIKNKYGQLLDFYLSAGPIFNENGELIAVFGIHTNISHRKKYEAELKTFNQKIHHIIEGISDPFFSLNKNLEFTYINSAAAAQMRSPAQNLIGKKPERFFKNIQLTNIKQAILSQKTINTELFYAPLKSWFHITIYPYKDGVSVYFKNINNQKNFENEITTLLNEKNEILESIADGFFTLNHQWQFTYWNNAANKLFKLKSKEILGKQLNQIFTPNLFPEMEKLLKKVTSTKKPLALEIFNNKLSKWFDVKAYPYREGASVYLKDITKEKKAFLEKQQYFTVIQESLNEIYLFNSTNFKFIYANHGAIKNIGYSLSELLKITPLHLKPNFTKKHFKNLVQPLLKGEKSKITFRTTHIRKNNTQYPVEVHLQYMKSASENIFLAHVVDITQQIDQENKLLQSEEKNRLVMNSALDAIVQMDNKGKVIFWNPQAEKIFGYTSGQALNKKLSSLIIPKGLRAKHDAGVARYLKTHKSNNLNKLLELNAINNNGESFPIELTILPIKQQNQEFFCAFIRDISERKKAKKELELSNRRYELVAKATNDSIYDWDLTTNKVYRIGLGLQNLFGYDPIVAQTKPNFWQSIIHPDDVNRIESYLKKSLKNKNNTICQQEYRLKKADGTYAFVNDKGYIIRNQNGKAVRLVGATQDITDLKEKEIDLIKLNKSLEKRAKELAASNAELEQFAYIASHDLQEPLRMVTSFLSQLENKYNDKLDDRAKQYIYFATDGATRMRQIILDLLDYSRAGREIYKIEEINTYDLVNGICQIYNNNKAKNNPQITIKKLPVIHAPHTQLHQVFLNLISNAVKYAQVNSNPKIEISCKTNTNYYQFAIKDNGIGIDKRFFHKIFELFQRLHGKSEFSGTGIGLAICKKIVEQLGGKIWVNSTLNIGSTFYFTVPKNINITKN